MPTFDVTAYGANGDGDTDDTDAIQDAVDACADAGGGVVRFPAGDYLTAPIFLRDDVTVHVENGATVLGSTDIDAYPVVDGRWEGVEREVYASLFTGHDLENVAVTGQGTLDAQGETWWHTYWSDEQDHLLGRGRPYPGELDCPRPRVINLYDCEGVLVRDVTIRDSPSWTVHPVYCENVTVDNVSIYNAEESPNTDGINPDSCRNVRIANCHVDVGDDCITIKSGFNEDGRRVGKPCENVVVTNCTMEHGHGGVVIGSEMSGDVRNVTVSNCVFDGTDNGLRIKTRPGRGGVVENVRATGVTMYDLRRTAFIFTTSYDDGKADAEKATEEIPELRNIHYSDITIDGATDVTTIRGLAETPVSEISLSNVRVTDADRGIEARDVDDVHLQNVAVDAAETPAVDIRDGTNVELDGVTDPNPDSDTPVVRLTDTDAVVRGCTARDGTGTFLEHTGGDVVTHGNHLAAADRDVTTQT